MSQRRRRCLPRPRRRWEPRRWPRLEQVRVVKPCVHRRGAQATRRSEAAANANADSLSSPFPQGRARVRQSLASPARATGYAAPARKPVPARRAGRGRTAQVSHCPPCQECSPPCATPWQSNNYALSSSAKPQKIVPLLSFFDVQVLRDVVRTTAPTPSMRRSRSTVFATTTHESAPAKRALEGSTARRRSVRRTAVEMETATP